MISPISNEFIFIVEDVDSIFDETGNIDIEKLPLSTIPSLCKLKSV